MPGVQWLNTAIDALVSRDPGNFHGCVLWADSDGGRATFYNGSDATTGEKIFTFVGLENQSNSVLFPVPLACPRGLFVEATSHLDEVLVLWEPVA